MPFYQDAEKLINEEFWQNTHDKRSNIDVKEIIGQALIEENKKKDPDYFNHREGVVHVSYLTRCLRGVVLEMLGAKPDAEPDGRKLGVFKAGNLFEEFIIESLGNRVTERQTEYTMPYLNLTVVGRSDFKLDDEGVPRIGEAKSVNSDAFWYRQKEGTLVQWHNQVQLQTYMWMERVLNKKEYDGLFTYVSKDDVTVIGAAIKYNENIIQQVVIPALNMLAAAYDKKDAKIAILPPSVVYNEAKGQYQKNWIAAYCPFHNQCAGANWLLEAGEEVTRRNKEAKASLNKMT